MVSFLLWFFSQLSKNYTYTLKIPVAYVNLPGDAYLDTSVKDSLTVELLSSGYQLLKLKFRHPVLEVDVQKQGILQRNYWLPPQEYKKLSQIIGEQNRLLQIAPDTLHLKETASSKKKLPVHPKLSIRYKQGYKNTKPYRLQPAEIWVFGDKKILDTLQEIATESYTFNELDHDLKTDLKLNLPQSLNTKEKKINLYIPVAQIIEDILRVKLTQRKVPSGQKLVVFPEEVRVRYKTFLPYIDQIDKKDFDIGVDFEKRKIIRNDTFLIPEIRQKPAGVFDVQIKPDKIAFLIQTQ